MARRLAPDERALWERVAATVTPLDRRAAPPPASPPPDALPAPQLRTPAARGLPEPPRRRPTIAPEDATLDGGWDRRIRSGRLLPDVTLDLHGLTRERAHELLRDRLAQAAAMGARVVLVITGKGSRPGPEPADLMDPGRSPRGAIRASLPLWLRGPDLAHLVAALRPAHPRHGGGGAWYVVLRRRKAD